MTEQGFDRAAEPFGDFVWPEEARSHAASRAQRCPRRLRLGDVLLGLLALGGFYLLRFALGGGFRRAVKAMTSPLEIVVVERRTFWAVDRHELLPSRPPII
jgi:hypothetical protein